MVFKMKYNKKGNFPFHQGVEPAVAESTGVRKKPVVTIDKKKFDTDTLEEMNKYLKSKGHSATTKSPKVILPKNSPYPVPKPNVAKISQGGKDIRTAETTNPVIKTFRNIGG